jgi:hypothetical protein
MQGMRDNTKKIVNNERGMALVSALVLGALGMLMVASLLMMVNTGTWVSGSQKVYQIALDSAYGGINLFTKEIIQRGVGGTNLGTMGTYGGILAQSITDADFTTKLTTTGNITDGIFPNDTVDVTVTLAFPSGPSMVVSTNIVSASLGNSGTSSNLLQGGGVVNNNSGTITPQHIPYLYQVDTLGQSAANPRENASLSSIYAY